MIGEVDSRHGWCEKFKLNLDYRTILPVIALQVAEVLNRPAQLYCVYSEAVDLDKKSFVDLRSALSSSLLGAKGPWPSKASSLSSSYDRGNLYCWYSDLLSPNTVGSLAREECDRTKIKQQKFGGFQSQGSWRLILLSWIIGRFSKGRCNFICFLQSRSTSPWGSWRWIFVSWLTVSSWHRLILLFQQTACQLNISNRHRKRRLSKSSCCVRPWWRSVRRCRPASKCDHTCWTILPLTLPNFTNN